MHGFLLVKSKILLVNVFVRPNVALENILGIFMVHSFNFGEDFDIKVVNLGRLFQEKFIKLQKS